ncbi:MAG: purine-nucleoside phosphorylase [Burkholderiaceae bacterium]|jgi:purine-nucleoside phosphorylase|nr:purine-nucleoside phosphorylase [Burkholderiaceae bacterium]
MSSELAASRIRALAPAARPRIAVLLGSGWGALTRQLVDAQRLPYAELPGFPGAGVAGHAGELWLGRLGAREVVVLSGRRHTYEDGHCDGMKGALRTLRALGIEVLVQTNAAGSLDPAMPAGSLMLLSDHLNLPQRSPLVGEGGSERFVDMVKAYDPVLRDAAHAAAVRRGITLHEGVYAWMLGPQFETPAEIRMLRTLGARAVGMSTVPETLLARWLGLRVLALSLITNLAAGLSGETLSHALTLAQAEAAGALAGALLVEIVQAIEI